MPSPETVLAGYSVAMVQIAPCAATRCAARATGRAATNRVAPRRVSRVGCSAIAALYVRNRTFACAFRFSSYLLFGNARGTNSSVDQLKVVPAFPGTPGKVGELLVHEPGCVCRAAGAILRRRLGKCGCVRFCVGP